MFKVEYLFDYSIMGVVPLCADDQERERYECLAEVYSLVVCIDQLERAFIRDSIGPEEYTKACQRLLSQYVTLVRTRELESLVGDLEEFCNGYGIGALSGVQRVKLGIPATLEANPALQPSQGETVPANGTSGKAVAEVTGLFITVMDGLKLKFRAKDQLHPLFRELVTSLNKVTSSDFEGRGNLVQWLVKLNKMKIDEVLSEEDVRQCLFDLDNAYKNFFTSLS